MSVELLLLDLDHTLFDPDTIPPQVTEAVHEAFREANRRLGALAPEALEASIDELARRPVPEVAATYGWPVELRRAVAEASARITLPVSLALYPDVELVAALPQRKVLVTTGVPSMQLEKVRVLGLESWLEAVHVDDVTAEPWEGKRALFERILEREALAPEGVLVVGDSLESEIAAAREIGLRTLHVARRGCIPVCPADHCRPDLGGLPELL